MYSDPACSFCADQVLDFLQERKDLFTLVSGSEILLIKDECELFLALEP